MANTFYRKPAIGGDVGAWGPYNDALNDASLGVLTGKLYNDGGALKVPACKIGINNGTNRGICDIDTVTTISLAGVSNSIWAAIEMTVAGTAVTFTATDIAGATDPAALPAGFTGAFDGAKGGFYLTATKRCIGLAWKNSSGVLLAIINTVGGVEDWWASEIGLHTGTIHAQQGPGKGFTLDIGDWNMDSTTQVNIDHNLGVFFGAIKNALVTIRNDAASQIYPLDLFDNAADPALMSGGLSYFDTGGQLLLKRRAGGNFDNATFDATTYNRGWITVHMRDF